MATSHLLVPYQLEFVVPDDDGEIPEGAARGRIFMRDVATGRFVRRGERKAKVAASGTEEERIERLRLFVEELPIYTSKLDAIADDTAPAQSPPPSLPSGRGGR